MATKVVVHHGQLTGSGQPDQLQRVATVYVDGAEYRVLAPPKATGDPLGWLEHIRVHRPDPEEFGSELIVGAAEALLIKKLFKEELEKTRVATCGQSDQKPRGPFYHVVVRLLKCPTRK
jgi:hypothetical protein